MESNKDLRALLDKDYMPIIYKNIKKFRKESGMSLMEVAEILDMSHDYLRRIESNNDKVKTCSLRLLIKFSILYNKPLGEFLNE